MRCVLHGTLQSPFAEVIKTVGIYQKKSTLLGCTADDFEVSAAP